MVAGQVVVGAEGVAVGTFERCEFDQLMVRAKSEVTRRQPRIPQFGAVHSPTQLFSGLGSVNDAGNVVDGQPGMGHRPGTSRFLLPASTAVADDRMIVPGRHSSDLSVCTRRTMTGCCPVIAVAGLSVPAAR